MRKLFTGVFGGFCVMITCIGLYNYVHFNRIHSIQEELMRIDKIAHQVQKHREKMLVFGSHHPFFDSIAVNSSSLNNENASFWEGSAARLNEYCRNAEKMQLPCSDLDVTHLTRSIAEAEKKIISAASEIGFKESGIIGRLRDKAHEMEKSFPVFSRNLLSLRRHEKDFLMRKDPVYQLKMHEEARQWPDNTAVPEQVSGYLRIFDTLAVAYIGLYREDESGLYHSWNTVFENFQQQIRLQRSAVLQASYSESRHAGIINLLSNSIAVFLAFGVTLFFLRRFSRQIVSLQRSMEQYIASNYQHADSVTFRIPRNEFGKITTHFLQLTRKIRADVQFLEDRVSRRTNALQLKNAQLVQQHIEITESLNYARDLQQSFLVSRSQIMRSFPEAQIYYKPKDQVGGDFYWMRTVKKGKSDLVYFALADCTGHGVPAALLSIMGMNALDELLMKEIFQPADLLNELRMLVSRRLNTESYQRYDGMDLSLFCWDRNEHIITFSGAQLPLWVLRNGEILELSGQRMPIGYTATAMADFTQCTLRLEPSDKLVLFTDGIADQFGGPDNKKLGKKRFREALKKQDCESPQAFFGKLISQLESWKGRQEQTDDCSLILLQPVQKNGSGIVKRQKKEALV